MKLLIAAIWLVCGLGLVSLTACGDRVDQPTVVPTRDGANQVVNDPSVCGGEKPVQLGDGRWVCP
jgi:hypothetical protein